MNISNLTKNKKSQVLIAAIAIIVMLALFGSVSISLLGIQTGQSAVGFVESSQAFYIAHAGIEWYLQQLSNDNDWTDEVNQTKDFANGSFTIEVSDANPTRISVKSTGKVTGPDGRDRQRYIALIARKIPSAFSFGIFWGRDTNSTLRLDNSIVNGDLWSIGDAEIEAGSLVSEIAYCPDNQDIIGAGSFYKLQVSSPYLQMPQIDETYYDNLISSWDDYIDDHATNSNITQSSNLVLNGNIIGCRNFTTSGNITISGNGYIVADRNIDLHSAMFAGTLTVTPSGGNIYFLAGRSLTVGAPLFGTNVTLNPGAYLYSGAKNNSNLLNIREGLFFSTTDLSAAFIIAKRRIVVEDGAQVANSTLYVSDVTDSNNYLQIRDSGTTVSGSIISVSGRDPGLIIENSASVSGLVYHWGDTSGYTEIDNASITGSVVASQYSNNRITGSTITYDVDSIPDILPQGFEYSVTIEPNSWDSL